MYVVQMKKEQKGHEGNGNKRGQAASVMKYDGFTCASVCIEQKDLLATRREKEKKRERERERWLCG